MVPEAAICIPDTQRPLKKRAIVRQDFERDVQFVRLNLGRGTLGSLHCVGSRLHRRRREGPVGQAFFEGETRNAF